MQLSIFYIFCKLYNFATFVELEIPLTMPIFTIRITWEEDDNVYRDFAIETGHSFFQLHEVLKSAFEFKEDQEASFYTSDDHWRQKMSISSRVEKNIKGAGILSMKKTPFSALVDKPDQKFVYIYDLEGKNWTFHIDMIAVKASQEKKMKSPELLKSVGVAPIKTRVGLFPKEAISEIEDQYDLEQSEMDEKGFSTE